MITNTKTEKKKRYVIYTRCSTDDQAQGDFTTLDAVAWFQAHGLHKRRIGDGKHAVTCPWAGEHSTLDAPYGTDTVIWESEPGLWPTFHCSHQHCERRSMRDVVRLLQDADAFCTRTWRRAA